MIFSDEDVRHAFHALPTQTQVDYAMLENVLAKSGRLIEICGVEKSDVGVLNVVVRISENID